MTGRPRVAVLDEIGEVGPLVEEAARHLGGQCWMVSDYATLGRVLDEVRHIDVLVVATDAIEIDDFKRLAVIHEEMPSLRMIQVSRRGVADAVASGEVELDDLLVLVARAGLTDALPYPVEAEAVRQALQRADAMTTALLRWAQEAGDGEDSPLGRVHAVTSARGGAGRTFFAINLAAYLARSPQNKTCIIDLDLPIGQVATALGVRPRFTLIDALEAGDDLATQLPSYCEPHRGGFSLLAAPPPEDAGRLTIDDALRVIAAAQRQFTHVVVDLPPATGRMALAVLREATDRWCLTTATIASLRTLTSVLPTIEHVDVPLSELRIVLNMLGTNTDVRVEEIDDVLPHGLTATLPWSKRIGFSTHVGRTVFDVEPQGDLASRLTALFDACTGEREPLASPQAKRSLIRNPFRRRS